MLLCRHGKCPPQISGCKGIYSFCRQVRQIKKESVIFMKKPSVMLAVWCLFCAAIFHAMGQAPAAPVDAAPVVPAATPAPADSAVAVETIVMIRHGEKPKEDQGQLTFQGLNRALALPDVLVQKYGKADYIFAPGSSKKKSGDGKEYSYIRPLITIEPTAIRLHLPVNANYAFDDLDGMQKELLSPVYKNSLIFVAWEHVKLDLLVKQMMTALGGDAAAVPEWPPGDYDSIFVVKIRTEGGKRSITFQHDQEGLDGQSEEKPEPKGK
jgi:hypothetical protein